MTDMSYLFNSMVNFNADISALGLTGHIRVYVKDMLLYVPTNITRATLVESFCSLQTESC